MLDHGRAFPLRGLSGKTMPVSQLARAMEKAGKTKSPFQAGSPALKRAFEKEEGLKKEKKRRNMLKKARCYA